MTHINLGFFTIELANLIKLALASSTLLLPNFISIAAYSPPLNSNILSTSKPLTLSLKWYKCPSR